MNNDYLYNELLKAGSIEESMMGALSKIIDFYLGDKSDSGLSEKDYEIIRSGLSELIKDTKKHRGVLAEIRAAFDGGSNDR